MPHRFENGVLVECDECVHATRHDLVTSNPVELPEGEVSEEGPARSTLTFVIRSMYRHFGGNSTPEQAREKVETLLANQGQFSEDLVSEVFEESSYETTEYSPEFEAKYDPEELVDFVVDSWSLDSDEADIPEETKYNFPFFPCESRIALDLCVMDPDEYSCPDCGCGVLNVPDHVAFGPENHLMCPSCSQEREDEFDSRGIILEGNPPHHGRWRTQEPSLEYMGTDYFFVTHPNCRGTDGYEPGKMLLFGVWVDDSSRVVLGLRCQDCGARNAIKPYPEPEGEIGLLNSSQAEWKRVESRARELLEKGENEEIDFKATMRRNLGTGEPDQQAEGAVMKEVVGFLNGEGGYILVGIRDDKTVIGVEKDYETFPNGLGADKLELHFNNMIEGYTGNPMLRSLVTFEIEELNGSDVVILGMDPAPSPVHLEIDGEEIFTVRTGTRSQRLEGEDKIRYIADRWPDGPEE